MKFINYLDENLLQIIIVIADINQKSLLFNQKSKNKESLFWMKGAWNRECCPDK